MKIFDILDIPSAVTHAPLKGKSSAGNITFNQMVSEAFTAVPTVQPDALLRWMEKEPKPLVIDVQDAADIAISGTVPGAVNISLGSLTYKADHEMPEGWRDSRLGDPAMLIVTTFGMGPLGALGAKLLRDMVFTNVYILNGGVEA